MTSHEPDRSGSVRPPRWAEAVLRALLGRDDAETVSGDLIEEYRESVTVHAEVAMPARRWKHLT